MEIVRPRVIYNKHQNPIIAFVKSNNKRAESMLSMITCQDPRCDTIQELDIMKITVPSMSNFEFHFILNEEDSPAFLYTDENFLVWLVTCYSESCIEKQSRILSRSSEELSSVALTRSIAGIVYPSELIIYHYGANTSSYMSYDIPSFQTLSLSAASTDEYTEIATQYWDTVLGKGFVDYFHCAEATCQTNFTQESLDAFSVLKGPWNPSIAVSTALHTTWLFYLKVSASELYAEHCSVDGNRGCRHYRLSSMKEVIKNEDQKVLLSLTRVWILTAVAICIIVLLVFFVTRSVNRVFGRVQYQEIEGED